VTQQRDQCVAMALGARPLGARLAIFRTGIVRKCPFWYLIGPGKMRKDAHARLRKQSCVRTDA